MVKDIRTISIRKEGTVGKAMGTGFILGAISGFLIGFTMQEDGMFTPGQAGGIMAVFGGAIGAVVGALSKAFKVNFTIDGYYNNYDKYKARLQRKALMLN